MLKEKIMAGAYTHEVTVPQYMWEIDKDWDILHDKERFIECLMKVVCGYSLGSTFTQFMQELGLAELHEEGGERLIATRLGREFLYFYYHTNQARFIFEGKDD